MPFDFKSININFLYNQFSELVLYGYNKNLNKNNIVQLHQQIDTPSTVFNHHSV